MCTLAAAALLLQGCANPGPPLPPSLHLPAQATSLRADRVGSHVVLSWTTPDKTSDGLPLKGPTTAALCREIAAPPAETPAHKDTHPAPCTPFAQIPVSPGASQATDTLPAPLANGPPRLIAYRVELLNARGRSANPSPPAFALAGAAPESPGPLHLSATRRGVLIQWPPAPGTPASGESQVQLSRILVPDATQATNPASSQTSPQPPSHPRQSPASPFQPRQPKNPNAPVLLQARLQNPSAPDPGGLLDPGALPHNTYAYTAQRVRTVTLDGHTLELRSALSPAVTFAFRDVFPPAAPSGLETVASAPIAAQPSIDLSWEPNSEPDLLGYNIYRADTSSAPFHRLNSEPIAGPAFRDLTAQPGQTYRYRVTAIDRNRNESPPGPETQDTIRLPEPTP